MGHFSFTKFVDLAGSNSLELVDNERISQLTGLTVQRIKQSTRINTRFILREGKEPVDLAYEVADRFLQQASLQAADIGGLALIHTHYDGSNASRLIAEEVAQRIGVSSEQTRAISFGCAGFPQIVSEAVSIAESLPDDKHVLIMTVETPDRMIDHHDRYAMPIFAAGAAATSIWSGEGHPLIFTGSRHVVPPDNPQDEEIFTIDMEDGKAVMHMKGELAYRNGSLLIEEATHECIQRVLSNPSFANRRMLAVPHQANAKMIKAFDDLVAPELQKQYNLSSLHFVIGMEGMGNTISTTIPSTLARIDGLISPPPQKGDIILMPAAGICVESARDKMSQAYGAFEW
jgi:3-oxoacyl-[acyl-carrier-protein] synthase III